MASPSSRVAGRRTGSTGSGSTSNNSTTTSTSTRPLSVVSVTGIGHSGYLVLSRKTAGKLSLRKTKSRLWFVFDVPSCKLMFSRSPQDAVGPATAANTLDIVSSTLMFGPDKNQFIVSAQGQEFHMTADSYESMMKWLSCLQACREQHRKQLEQLEIDMGMMSTADMVETQKHMIPGTMMEDDSDPEEENGGVAGSDGYLEESNSAEPPGRLSRLGTAAKTEHRETEGFVIGSKHASIVLDPQEFLSEMFQRSSQPGSGETSQRGVDDSLHSRTAETVLEGQGDGEDSQGEAAGTGDAAVNGKTAAPTDLSLDGESKVEVLTHNQGEATDWQATAATSSASVKVRARTKTDSAAGCRNSSSDFADGGGDVAMAMFSRQSFGHASGNAGAGEDVLQQQEQVGKTGAEDQAEKQGLTNDQSAGESRLTDSLKSFHSGFTMWEHFEFRNSEIGRNDLVEAEEEDDAFDEAGLSSHQRAKLAKDSRQVRSLKSSLGQLESDLRMALNQIARLECREQTYKQQLAKQEVDMSQKTDGRSISLLSRKRSNTANPTVLSQQQEIEDLEMAVKRYHEQNVVMTKEVVQLVEGRHDEQRRCQQFSLQCRQLSVDMVRLSISYVEVLQESYPIRLKSAPGDAWDEETRMDPLETKNQNRVYAQLVECHRYDHRIPLFNKGSPGGKHTDHFGFEHTWDDYNVEMHYYLCDVLKRHYQHNVPESVEMRQEANWKGFLADNLGDITKVSQRSNELKSLIVNGIPTKQRPGVWKSLIAMRLKKYREAKGPTYYLSLQGYQNSHSRQIQVDLHRTLTSHVAFTRGSHTIAKLQRVLLAYSIHNPHVGYCQGMNMLVGLGLIVLEDEEEVFWLLVALVERYLPDHYFDKDLVGAQADQLLMKELLEEKLPSLAQHLDFYGIDVAMVTFNWCLTVFVDAVPTDTLLRIWDCLLFEGNRVLFRFSLAILQWHAPRLQRIHDPITLFQHLKLMAKLAYDEEELTKIAYISLHPFASRKHMAARREHYVAIKTAVIDEDDAARMRQRREQAPVAFKSPVQRKAALPSDASKRQTVWECGAQESAEFVWLCEGDREAGFVSVLRLSTAHAALVECDLQSRIMSICKLQSRHILMGTLLGNLTAFLSGTGCELFTVQLKDSVLSLAAMDSGKTFAGLADGTLVVFEKFTAQAISREVLLRSGISITSLLIVSVGDCPGRAGNNAKPRGGDTTEPDAGATVAGASGAGDGDSPTADDVPDTLGAAPKAPLVEGSVGNLKLDTTTVGGDHCQGSAEAVGAATTQTSANGSRLMLWCGCGNKLLVLDTDTLEEVTSIQLSSNVRNNISHLRQTEHGVWTVMHRTATVELWSPSTFSRLLSVNCDTLLKEGLKSEDGLAIPVFQRATAFAVGSHSVWLGTANGYLIISQIVQCCASAADGGGGLAGGQAASNGDGLEASSAPAVAYKLRLTGLHRVSEDALRVVLLSRSGDEDVAVVCPQHTAPQLWKLHPTTDSERGGATWKSQLVDCESLAIEDLLHIEKRPKLVSVDEGMDRSLAFSRSVDFLAEAEMIERDEIIIKEAKVDEAIEEEGPEEFV